MLSSGRIVHSSLFGSHLCTGANRRGTFITSSAIPSGSMLKYLLELGGVTCHVGCYDFIKVPTHWFTMLPFAVEQEHVWYVV